MAQEAQEIDPCKLLGIRIDQQGKVTRSNRIPTVPPSCTATGPETPEDGVLSKDVTIDPPTGLTARIFLPQQQDADFVQRLPVVLSFHGGGFVMYRPSTILFHGSCHRAAKACNAIFISVDYRLAPEDRLPAAYENAVAALRWLRSQALGTGVLDPWLESRADFSRVFLSGESSGANIAYNLGLRVFDETVALQVPPLRIAGVVLIQPFFGGIERTTSEVRRVDDKIVPLPVSDLLWRLALPDGADRDHPFCNPLKGSRPSPEVLRRFPATMVAVEGLDPLLDRQLEFVKMLQEAGVHVEQRMDPTGSHGVELLDMAKAKALCRDISNFMSSSFVTPSTSSL